MIFSPSFRSTTSKWAFITPFLYPNIIVISVFPFILHYTFSIAEYQNGHLPHRKLSCLLDLITETNENIKSIINRPFNNTFGCIYVRLITINPTPKSFAREINFNRDEAGLLLLEARWCFTEWVIPTVVLILAIPRGNPSVIVRDLLCKPIAYILSRMLTKGRTWVLCLLNYLSANSVNPLQQFHNTNGWSVQGWDFRYFRPVIPKLCAANHDFPQVILRCSADFITITNHLLVSFFLRDSSDPSLVAQ